MISFNYLASPGQLGNQMFKFAALKGISSSLNTVFLMPPSYAIANIKPLYKILNKINIVDQRNHVNHLLFKFFKMGSVEKSNIGYSNFQTTLQEESFNFDSKFIEAESKFFDIYGYFQSYRYFEDIKTDLINDFTFKDRIQNKSNLIYDKLENPISIHIRRGDYLTNPNHTVLDLEYYENSIDMLGYQNNYIIFSDDSQWCKNQNIFKSDNFIFAEDLTSSKQEVDLCLMSLCNRHIIANSTFSWWGAYLSNQETVIAPRMWFGKTNYSNNNTPDLYPDNWELVEN